MWKLLKHDHTKAKMVKENKNKKYYLMKIKHERKLKDRLG